MEGILYGDENNALFVFIGLTLILGGAAAFSTGRAIAKTWRPAWMLVLYMVPLAAAVRFLSYALFEETLLSPPQFLVAYVFVVAVALVGYRSRRTQQMTQQYGWAFEPSGPLSWKTRT